MFIFGFCGAVGCIGLVEIRVWAKVVEIEGFEVAASLLLFFTGEGERSTCGGFFRFRFCGGVCGSGDTGGDGVERIC